MYCCEWLNTNSSLPLSGGILTGSLPGQLQQPLMSVAKQPGQLATQGLPGQQLPGQALPPQLPPQLLQQLGNQIPGLQQLPGQTLPGQQLLGQQLGMPGLQMPNLILNSNGQLILTNPPQQMLGPQTICNDGQLQQPGALQPQGQLQPNGQIQQPGGPIQPGSLVGVKNMPGAQANLPQALLLPNGQIVPVVTQPSMLFPGCQPVPGGVLLPKNPGATLMPPGGALQQPLNIPASGVLQNNAIVPPTATSMVGQMPQTLIQTSNGSIVMTSVVTTVSPALPSVTKPVLQAGTSGLVSGVRPSLISVSKGPVMTTSIGPPVSMASSINNGAINVTNSGVNNVISNNDIIESPVAAQVGTQVNAPTGAQIGPQIVTQPQVTARGSTASPIITQGANPASTPPIKPDPSCSVATTTAHISSNNGASTTAMAILNPDGTLVLTLPPGTQPNNLVLDPNTMPPIKTSTATSGTVKKGGKKSGQRVLMPKPTLSGGIMTLPGGIPVPSLAPTIISNPPQVQNLVFTPPASNTQVGPDLEKPQKPKQTPKSDPTPLVVNVEPAMETSSEVAEKKTDEPDLLAQATESIFSETMGEISPPVSTFYQAENDEGALQIDTSAQETEDAQNAPQVAAVVAEQRAAPLQTPVVPSDHIRSPQPPVSSSFIQEPPVIQTVAPPDVVQQPEPAPVKKKKKKKKKEKEKVENATTIVTPSVVGSIQSIPQAPVSMVVTTAQTTLPSESIVTMTTASQVSHSVACSTPVSTVSDTYVSMPSYFPYPMTSLAPVSTEMDDKPSSTINTPTLLSPDAGKSKKSKKKKDSHSKETHKSTEPAKTTAIPVIHPTGPVDSSISGPLSSTPKSKKKSKKDKNKDSNKDSNQVDLLPGQSGQAASQSSQSSEPKIQSNQSASQSTVTTQSAEPMTQQTVSTPPDVQEKPLNTMDFFPESISFSESDLNSVLDQVCQAPVSVLFVSMLEHLLCTGKWSMYIYTNMLVVW